MKIFITSLIASTILLLAVFTVQAQTTPLRSHYPDTLWSETDTFYVKSSTMERPFPFTTTQGDTVDLGTDGYEGMSFRVYTTTDTLTIPYVNAPFIQHAYIPIASPNSSIIYKLRFNLQSSVFSDDYIEANTGQASFSIPETYELANIILYLSDCSEKTGNYPDTEYSQKVVQHFAPFKNHAIVQLLNQQCSEERPYHPYYNFRENSICYTFEGDKLVYGNPYTHVMGDWQGVQGSLFREFAYLVQDFATQSRFREFYQENAAYYQALEQRQEELMPVRQMWDWLEAEFPIKIQSYKVFFSPLIGGSHSTQRFYHGSYRDSKFYEVAMFVNGPESVDQRAEYSEQRKEGLLSGVVFTEIDHNYVNPTTTKHRNKVNSIFDDREIWTKPGGDTDNYTTPSAVFNEYMTHALFCLYVQDTYDEETVGYVIDARENLMTERRHYIKFAQFNEKLAELYKSKAADETVADLYPKILEWAESVE